MKTRAGAIKSGIAAVMAVSLLVGLRVYAEAPASPAPSPDPDRVFILKITQAHEFKQEKAFDDTLDNLSQDAVYKIRKHSSDGTWQDKQSKKVTLKTEQKITSELAKNVSSAEFTAIGVHVTQTVASNSLSDIQKVIDQLK
jgi:hypothetical protein